MLAQKRGEKAVEKRKEKRSYLETVLISIGTDDYLRPAQHIDIKCRNIGLDLAVYLDSATDNSQKVCDYLTLEYLVVAALHTVERFSADGDYCLIFGISSELTGSQSRVTLNYIELADSGVF